MKRIVLMVLIFALIGCAHKPWTRAEKVAAGAFILAHLANAYTTERHQDHPEFHEMNPVMGSHPSDLGIATYFALTGVGVLIAAHYIPKLRIILLGGVAVGDTYYSIHDVSLIRRKAE